MIYAIYLFIYLKIWGVFGIAVLTDATATSEGIDYKYEFQYKNETYSGSFTDISKHEIGEKNFVSFSKFNPNKNLLQYHHKVPDCLKEYASYYWDEIPTRSTSNIVLPVK